MDYIDLDTVKTYGGFTDTSDEQDALLLLLISTASAMIDGFCGRKFGIDTGEAAQVRTFTKDNGLLPLEGRKLYLPEDLVSIVVVPTAIGATLTFLPDATPYYAVVRDSGLWEDPTTITGFWAYAMTPPSLIQTVTARVAIWLYHQTEAVMSQGNTVNTPNDLPADIKVVLAPYKRVMLP